VSEERGGSVKRVAVWIFGVGGVGTTLLEMLNEERVQSRLAARAGLRFSIVGLVDSRGYVIEPAGLSSASLADVVALKRAGQPLLKLPGAREAPAAAALEALRQAVPFAGTIGVDATASEVVGPLWGETLGAGACIVLANKRPLTQSWEQFVTLIGTRRCRYESTVGAGLPIIATLTSLLDTGDVVTAIQGCFSGTLGYICSALRQAQSYSTAVLAAAAAGYTEPDPRDDLGGMDVARKALILSRMLGRPLNLTDLDVEPMIPVRLMGLSLEGFLERLPEGDAEMAERVSSAARHGQVLSYVADLSAERPRIGLREVEADSPIGRLTGTDNIALFQTSRYNATPLIIQGPGAGRAVTAAGLLSDMISLSREEPMP
jgi:homoserine dehydrogenase